MSGATMDEGGKAEEFRVVIVSGVEPRILSRLIADVHRKAATAKVCGVLYHRPTVPGLGTRIRNLLGSLAQPGYARYCASRLGAVARDAVTDLARLALRLLHAGFPRPRAYGLPEFEADCRAQGCRLLVCSNVHAVESLAFVRQLQPDLGLVFGAPILRPELFEIPRLGAINLHQRKVPDYRGGGPIGLWEMLDAQKEIGVTVHRVLKKLDAGPVIRASTIPIEPYDTLRSLAMKAHVVGIDLLVQSVADFASGTVEEAAQTGPSRVFRSPTPIQLRAFTRQLSSRRPIFVPERGWPTWKLIARCLLLGPAVVARNWYRRLTGSFPIVALYHHVITDRPHFNGMPTDAFLRQLDYLHRYYRVVDIVTAARMLESGRISEPTVVLTFDDGYKDNWLNLRAAALCADVPATLFVCSQRIDAQQPFDHDVERGSHDFLPLDWRELRELEAWGFHVGAHTRTHFDCGSRDQDRLIDEIPGAREELERHLGHAVDWFSFPAGCPRNMSRPAIELAKKSYTYVSSAYGGVNCPSPTRATWHLFRYPHPASLLELELLLQSILILGQPPLWEGGDNDPGATNLKK